MIVMQALARPKRGYICSWRVARPRVRAPSMFFRSNIISNVYHDTSTHSQIHEYGILLRKYKIYQFDRTASAVLAGATPKFAISFFSTPLQSECIRFHRSDRQWSFD